MLTRRDQILAQIAARMYRDYIMAMMKSRHMPPPGGWEFFQPQTGFRPVPIDFLGTVRQIIDHRKGNAWITQQHNLSLNQKEVETELDEFNAAKCLAHPGWEHYASGPSGGSNPKAWSLPAFPRRLLSGVAAAGANVRRTAAGVKLVVDWLGDSLRPVDHELAEKRAAVCVKCPKNQDPNWLQTVDAAVAAQIKTLVEVKNDLKLSTSQDEQLNTCSPCDCYLKLKVHAPLKHILANTSDETKAKLDPSCWILNEQASTPTTQQTAKAKVS